MIINSLFIWTFHQGNLLVHLNISSRQFIGSFEDFIKAIYWFIWIIFFMLIWTPICRTRPGKWLNPAKPYDNRYIWTIFGQWNYFYVHLNKKLYYFRGWLKVKTIFWPSFLYCDIFDNSLRKSFRNFQPFPNLSNEFCWNRSR